MGDFSLYNGYFIDLEAQAQWRCGEEQQSVRVGQVDWRQRNRGGRRQGAEYDRRVRNSEILRPPKVGHYDDIMPVLWIEKCYHQSQQHLMEAV